MFLYVERINEQLERIRSYSSNLKEKFESDADENTLLADAENLDVLHDALIDMLPPEIANVSSFGRHVAWMKKRLKEGRKSLCQQDIVDICDYDLPEIEQSFRNWLKKPSHMDEELASKISNLLSHHQYDSVIRKSFVILKNRLLTTFNFDNSDIDGQDLVNQLFGKASDYTSHLDPSDRQAIRDLLSGLYGVYRNKYAHNDDEADWHEVDAVVSMVNTVLLTLPGYVEKKA